MRKLPIVYRNYCIIAIGTIALLGVSPLIFAIAPRTDFVRNISFFYSLIVVFVALPSLFVYGLVLRQKVVLNRGFVCPETGMVLRKLGIPESVRQTNFFEDWRFLFRRRAGYQPLRFQGSMGRRYAAMTRWKPVRALLDIQRRRYGFPLSGGIAQKPGSEAIRKPEAEFGSQ